MANSEKNWPEDFRHKTEIGPDGRALYCYPVIVGSKIEGFDYDTLHFLKTYFGIEKKDCHTIKHAGLYAYYLMIPDRKLAEDEWKRINSQHSRKFAHDRCMVPGTRKDFILCPDTNSCENCPYGKMEKEPSIISWDCMTTEERSSPSAEDEAMSNIQREELYTMMRAEDPRIEEAHKLKTVMNYGVEEIAAILKVSPPRIYQLLERAKQIIKQYQEN